MSGWPPEALQDFAEALPFEHLVRRRPQAEAISRWRAEADAANDAGVECGVALLLAAGGYPKLRNLTLASWALQTWSQTPWIELVDDAAGANPSVDAVSWCAEPIARVPGIDSDALISHGIKWVVPAMPGDILHPSLAWIVARASSEGADIVAWDWLVYELSQSGVVKPRLHVRAPARDGIAELRVDFRGRACALRAADWQGQPGAPHHARFSIPRTARAINHPEPLGLYPRHEVTGDLQPRARGYWGVDLDACPRGYAWPRLPAPSIAVAILFRDRAEMTCRAIRSVVAQQLPGSRLELVLVDNRSNSETRAQISECLASIPASITVVELRHDGAFNHSRQVQLAVDATQAEVIVLLNNDAEIVDEDALDRLSRWASVPGVASVGGQVVDSEGACVGGGFLAREAPGPLFNSPVEEAMGVVGARSRESIGNTFACVAIRRDVFTQLGGLDGAWFSAGYNDVDYALRAVAMGWTHITLAEVRVRHAVGTSRGRQDEIAQKSLLRQRHPWVSLRACTEVEVRPVDLPSMAIPGGFA